jgi:hypothetical protein
MAPRSQGVRARLPPLRAQDVSRPAIAAIGMGCCHEQTRCVLCPPPPPLFDPETVEALALATERDERRDRPVWVGFYGGPPPPPALVEAAGGRPLHVRVRPDLLDRATARRLIDAGAQCIELDALTLHNGILRSIGRRYRRSLIFEQLEGLREMGVENGIVLAPGLPGATFEMFLDDAQQISGRADTARLHPVLVLHDSRLRDLHQRGFYKALSVAEAVAACEEALDVLEAGGVRVLRVGQQATPDGLGRAIAGPKHPSLRELVEGQRTLKHLRSVLSTVRPGRRIELRCSPSDLSRARGPRNQNVRALRAEFRLSDLVVRADPDLPRGEFAVTEAPA